MKITANRREEIEKARAEYDAAAEAQHKKHEDQVDAFRRAQFKVCQGVKALLQEKLGNHPDMEIRVEPGWRWTDGENYVEVTISINEANKFADDVALSWDWRTSLDNDGKVKHTTGSWSGMKATTPAQLDDLRRSLKLVETLNGLDWESLVKVELPKWEDHVTERDVNRNDRPNFEQQLRDLDIEDAIGKPVLYPIAGRPHSWFAITKMTPKQVGIVRVPTYTLVEGEYRAGRTLQQLIDAHDFGERMTKQKFFETVDMSKEPWTEANDKQKSEEMKK